MRGYRRRLTTTLQKSPAVIRGRNVTVLWNPVRGDNAAEVATMADAARKLGVSLDSQQVRDQQELDVVLHARTGRTFRACIAGCGIRRQDF